MHWTFLQQKNQKTMYKTYIKLVLLTLNYSSVEYSNLSFIPTINILVQFCNNINYALKYILRACNTAVLLLGFRDFD